MSNNTDEDIVKIRVPLHKDLAEKLDNDPDTIISFLSDLYEIHAAAVTMTATVYLRRECADCFMHRGVRPLLDWVNTEGYKILTEQEDVPQFQRQVAIWSKDYTINEIKLPCTGESEPVLH